MVAKQVKFLDDTRTMHYGIDVVDDTGAEYIICGCCGEIFCVTPNSENSEAIVVKKFGYWVNLEDRLTRRRPWLK